MKPPAIGIDLGTNYSCVGIWRDDRVEIIPNENGDRTTPSIVSFTQTECLIGEEAKNLSNSNPKNTIYDVKRLIGRKFSDKVVLSDLPHWPFKVIPDLNNLPVIKVEYKNEIKYFKPEEISAMILTKLKEITEKYIGLEVNKAVIAVPAYFSDSQRQATRDSGRIAGLEVLRLINEPTAAAIAFRLDEYTMEELHVLIFDLGGGTFDVSLLAIEERIFEILATSGNTHLGGQDFDNRMVEHLLYKFKKKHNIDVFNNQRAIRRLRNCCERAKRILSSSIQTTIELDAFNEGIDFHTHITRVEFEELNMDLFKSCIVTVDNILKDAKIDKSKISEIVMVGGSSKIPKIQQLLQEFFNGKELNLSVNPDEAVARGAAIQASFLYSGRKALELVFLDVTPLSLGVETSGGTMTVIIPRVTTIPVKKTNLFSTDIDNQKSVLIKIYQGERSLTKDNILLGTLELSGIPPMPRGIPQIEVSFDIDVNGILQVTATLKNSEISNKYTIVSNVIGSPSQVEIERILSDAIASAESDKKIRESIESKNKLESYCYHIKSSLGKLMYKLSMDDQHKILEVVDETLSWLYNSEKVTAAEIVVKLEQLESIIMPILSSVSQYSLPNYVYTLGSSSEQIVDDVE